MSGLNLCQQGNKAGVSIRAGKVRGETDDKLVCAASRNVNTSHEPRLGTNVVTGQQAGLAVLSILCAPCKLVRTS